MINGAVNRKWSTTEFYLFYWGCYLLLFTFIQGLTNNDFLIVFRNELFSVLPKALFVWIVVERLTIHLLFNQKVIRFISIYILLAVAFGFLLRLVDNYIILKYFLTGWIKESLLSIAPFLYNIIKLQFLLAIPFCLKLYRHLNAEKDKVQKREAEENDSKKFLHIKCERRHVNLLFNDICYFEAQGNYLSIITIKGVYKAYMSISELESNLPDDMFARIHRSFIVALNKIESHTSSTVIIRDQKIPIGRSYSSKAKNVLT